MSKVLDALRELETALQTVPDVQEISQNPGTLTQWPALVIGPPQVLREQGGSEPTGARFPVYAVVEAGEQVTERLCLLEADVAAAIDEHTSGVVVDSGPFAFPQGTADLPSYQLIVEVGLR